jgi:hypothetical protein
MWSERQMVRRGDPPHEVIKKVQNEREVNGEDAKKKEERTLKKR